MIEPCISNLKQIKQVLESSGQKNFVMKLDVLSGASIGQHVRHVLEFYLCLLNGLETGTVNYDHRERNLEIENQLETALATIDKLILNLNDLNQDQALKLEGDAGVSVNVPFSIATNLQRELAYNLEHSIHHQAIIKIGLKQLSFDAVLSKEFGVAPSTLRSH
jgi:uncharacterized damage-inducible protein DinB